ncbi:MAG: hypothetical protein BroJett018_51080 [Chloroflexota bacterium]|nr:MAG: hypothetical protein BroJett018_51080 [Chloroflexota bacterium]
MSAHMRGGGVVSEQTPKQGPEPAPEPTAGSESEQVIEVDLETLDLVYSESKEAYQRLMEDLEAVSQRAERSVQLSLVVLSITIGLLGTRNFDEFSELVQVLLLLGLGFLAGNAVYVLLRNALARQVYSGTIFPDVLYNRMNEDSPALKVDLVRTLAESYFYNHQLLLAQGRVVALAQSLQIVGVLLLLTAAILVLIL